MRKRIYEIISVPKKGDKFSVAYDVIIVAVIIASLIPLCYKEESSWLLAIDRATAGVFIIDYILRWIVADYRNPEMKKKAFFQYPFTPFAIIDLLSILPSFTIINQSFQLLRLIRALRAVRVFKLLRYSRRFRKITKILLSQKKALLSIGAFVIGYILVTGLIIYQVEPGSFENLSDALFWSTTTITRANYTGVAPVTPIGEVVSMISSIIGLAIIALPTGLISGAFLAEMSD